MLLSALLVPTLLICMLLSFVLSLKSVAFVQLVILLMVVFCVELVLGICCFLHVSTAFGFS